VDYDWDDEKAKSNLEKHGVEVTSAERKAYEEG
jgi:uncharacterized DUF497 family protein